MAKVDDTGALEVLFVTRRTSGVGRRMESVLAALQVRRRNLRIVHVDADAQPDLVGKLGVRQVPTTVFLKQHQPVATICGRATLEELEGVLAAVASSSMH